jgi:two-component system NtrC family sensor kinase
MPGRTLSTRIALPAGFFALVSVAALSYLLIRTQREHALEEAVLGTESVGETIQLTIEHEMRVNEREAIREIVETVGRQEGIESVRILNKDGRISFSSDPADVGDVVDMQAEACVTCHSGPAPTSELDPDNRSRTFTDRSGHHVLGTIRVIRNQEGCQGAGCHPPVASKSVLGVLDITMSLEPARIRLADATRSALLFSFLAVALITGTLYFMIARSIRRPLDTVIAATRRVAFGDPSVELPHGAAREIGILASSFNEMVENLNSSRSQLEDWAGTLEEKVVEKAKELRAVQFQVAQAEKLSSVGLVAAGIAHELNSPLMAIITFTHLVKRAVPADSPAQEDLRMIEREANRCAAIIRQLLDFSRKQSADTQTGPCDLHKVIDGALELLKIEVQNGGVDVHTRVPDDLPLIEANQVQLMQVFVNLILNAVQAMPEGGEIFIEADVVNRREYAHLDLPPHAGSKLLRTVVRDTGPGIQPENLNRVFDPFFTTKPVGKGSGLGLSVSLGIARSYRGIIAVQSDGATGTTFTVLLPVPQPAGESRS